MRLFLSHREVIHMFTHPYNEVSKTTDDVFPLPR